jgi:hypothetical protein
VTLLPQHQKASRKRRKPQLPRPNPATLAFWATVIAALIGAVAQILK